MLNLKVNYHQLIINGNNNHQLKVKYFEIRKSLKMK